MEKFKSSQEISSSERPAGYRCGIVEYLDGNYEECRKEAQAQLWRSGLRGEELTREVDAVLARVVTSQNSYHASMGEPLYWVRSIARNYAIDRHRARKGVPKTVPLDTPGIDKELPSLPNPAEEFERQRLLEKVRAAVAALPPGQSEAVRLCDLEEYEHADAAAKMGIPVRRLEYWLAEGRIKLGQDRGLLELYYGRKFSRKEARSKQKRNKGNARIRG